MIESLNNTALSGIQQGLNKLQKNAEQIATATSTEADTGQLLLAALVDLKANETQVSASMKVLNVSDRLIGSILDIKA